MTTEDAMAMGNLTLQITPLHMAILASAAKIDASMGRSRSVVTNAGGAYLLLCALCFWFLQVSGVVLRLDLAAGISGRGE